MSSIVVGGTVVGRTHVASPGETDREPIYDDFRIVGCRLGLPGGETREVAGAGCWAEFVARAEWTVQGPDSGPSPEAGMEGELTEARALELLDS